MNTKQLTQFRHEVYQNCNTCKRTNTLMDLVDAISSNTTARSVVALSLNPHFRRHYTALNQALTQENKWWEQNNWAMCWPLRSYQLGMPAAGRTG